MRDHHRILGTLFIAWGAAQLVSAVVLTFVTQPRAGAPPFFWAVALLLAVAYGYVGWRLRAHAPGIRIFAILLSIFALISIPFGTAIGIYGLWVMFARKHAHAAP